jgi:hypothetical protein
MHRLLLGAFLCSLLPLPGQVDVGGQTGSVQVRILYNGQPFYTGIAGAAPYLAFDNFGWYDSQHFSFVFDQGDRLFQNIPVGPGTITYRGFPNLPPINFNVTANQTTTVDIETATGFGIVTGTVILNGQTPTPGQLTICTGQRACDGTDATGRFRLLTPAGPRTGTIRYGTYQQSFSFTAVAGTTIEIGGIAVNHLLGNVQTRILYNGQPFYTGIAGAAPYLAFDNFGWYDSQHFNGVFDQGDRLFQNIPTGPGTITYRGFPSLPPITFNVTADQTTNVDIETATGFGIVTGTIILNGQTPTPGQLNICTGQRACDGTDGTGRFRLLTPAGPRTGTIRYGTYQQPFSFTAVAGTTIDIGSIAVNHLLGNVQVRVLYNGQPFYTGIAGAAPYLAFDNFGWYDSQHFNGVFDQGDRLFSNIPVGPGTLTYRGFPSLPPINFNVSANQTTTVSIDAAAGFGIVTGTVSVNGQVPTPGQVNVCTGQRACQGNDATGRFRLMTPAGARTGTAAVGPNSTSFSFNAVAGQTRDIGSPGSTTLNGLISGKSGTLPNRTWRFRITNQGPGAATSPTLNSLTLTQTFGTPCTPVITSAFPIPYIFLAPNTSADADVQINFGSCAANARFTANFQFSANAGSVTGTRALSNQQP